MRLVRYFPMIAIGAGFVCQAALPLAARAWDNPAIEVDDQSSAAPQNYSAAPQNNGRVYDPAVKPAGYYDSRPRPNATTIAPPDAASNGREPLFRGQAIHFPKMLFGRQTPNNQQMQSGQQSAKPTNYSPTQNRFANQNNQSNIRPNNQSNNQSMSATGRPIQPRVMASTPETIGRPNYQSNNQQNFQPNSQPMRSASSRPPMPIRQDPRPIALSARPAAAIANNSHPTNNALPENGSSVSPWSTTPAAAATTAAARPKSPSPADMLVAQAHEWSTTAKTDQDYTRIIETCRRAQASHASPEAMKYANNLTAWSFNRRGQLKAEAGQDKQAILDFDDALRCDATCWRAAHNRGVLLAQSGHFEKAFDDFGRTIQFNPKFAKAYSNRAALFMVANNLKAAEQDYNHAVELDSNLAVAHRGYGRVLQLEGRLDEACGHYDAAVQLAPTDAYAAACRADLLTDLGRYSEALAEYNRALEVDPKSSQAHCGLAWLLATCPDNSLRNPEQALSQAKSAIELSERKDAVSFDSLAAAQASAGDFKSALQSIHTAIQLAPADERESYRERLIVYQQAKPYRIAPVDRVAQQTSYASGNGESGAGSKRF